jgi:hypothetical protein
MEPLTTKEIITIVLLIGGATYIVWRCRLLGLLAAMAMAWPAIPVILPILVVFAILAVIFKLDE